ncbi:hypothetical protein [Caudoviricetes sp.]|nr:hypothetical protein [Caudoviricetes sp.]UOF78379.1 hypothetical protein [Bacteriophage sp.]
MRLPFVDTFELVNTLLRKFVPLSHSSARYPKKGRKFTL